VKYSYEYMLDPKNKSIRRPIFSPIQEIRIEDPTRVVFLMSRPFRPFFQYQTKFMGIFPKGSREVHGDMYFAKTPIGVGTGPGVFVDWTPDDRLEIARNPTYWRKGVPAWNRVVAKIVTEDAARVAYLTTNQAQIISAPPPHQFADLGHMPNVETGTKVAIGGMWFMQLNNRRKPFDDINFRKAVSCAIDRDKMAKDVFYNLISPSAVPAASVVPWFNAEANASLSYDLDKARAYLAKSKYKQEPTFDLLVPNPAYLFDSRDGAVVMQAQLAAVGITMNIRDMEMPQILGRVMGGNHVATLLPLMGPSDPTFLVQICYTPNQAMSKSSGYSNPALDAAITESYRHTDLPTLIPIYKQIQAILAEDSPHVWLGFLVVANAWRSEVKDFKVNTGLTIWVRDVKLA
jgi:peptide/nickel transport system substrate-binding protein